MMGNGCHDKLVDNDHDTYAIMHMTTYDEWLWHKLQSNIRWSSMEFHGTFLMT